MSACIGTTARRKPCRLPILPGFDGCEHHRTVSPNTLLLEEAHRAMQRETCAELHSPEAQLSDTERYLDAIDQMQWWAKSFYPDAKSACWSWDASEATLAGLRVELVRERAERAPAGTSDVALTRDLDWELLVEWHQGRCAMCGRLRDLDVDHDHNTRLIRGLLCRPCNISEGHHGGHRFEKAKRHYRYGFPRFGAARYGQRPPAVILGVRRSYSKKNDFPEWCRLGQRGYVGALPAGMKPQEWPWEFGGVRRDATAVEARGKELEAWELAEARLKSEMIRLRVRSRQWFSCRTCPGWRTSHVIDFRSVRPIAIWVKGAYPGVHERAVRENEKRGRLRGLPF